MLQDFQEKHETDVDGNPAGGHTEAIGLTIDWQDGPLSVDGERKAPNGAFVETVIAAAIGRLRYYQTTRFRSEYNEDAIMYLETGMERLHARTADREERGVEGTHKL